MTEIVQGTQEWKLARAGKVTASRLADVCAKLKSGQPAASRTNYRDQLVAERLNGVPYDSGFVSKEMAWGTECEPQARLAYEVMTGASVGQVGFVDHPELAMTGASPDGLVGQDGLVEIKCPNTSTHIETLEGGAIDSGYYKQMQWAMACTGRQWCDFISYDPRMPGRMSIKIIRVQRNDAEITALTSEVVKFLAEIDVKVSKLLAMYPEIEA